MPPITIDQALQIALQHQQAGRTAEAEHIYRQVLAQQPLHFEALNKLSLIAARAGRHEIAIDLLQQMLLHHPGRSWVHGNLGEVYRRSGKLAEAIAELRKAIALNANDSIAHFNLGVALAENHQLDDAIAAYRQAITRNPAHPEAYTNLGAVLARKGQLDEAAEAYRHALRLKPDLVEAWNNLGNVLTSKFLLHDAAAHYLKALQLDPGNLDARVNLGNVQKDLGQLDEAIATYHQALRINPDSAMVHNNLGNALKDQGRLDEALACFDRTIALQPNDAALHSNRILCSYYHPAFDAAAILQECRQWDRRHAQPLRGSILPHTNDCSPDRRLKIGYVSADLREHSVAHFLKPLLSNHDRRQFQIFCYSGVKNPDAQTRQIQALSDQWRSLVGLSDDQAAAAIRDDRIDILVDLGLHSANNRLLAFARKPAPVQVTWLGYAGTTGLSTMDYRLTDPWLDPPGSGDEFYTEKSIRLPHTFWCYQPMLETVAVNTLPALESGRITFACFNNFAKATPAALDLWARVLAAVPSSRILIFTGQGNHRDVVHRRFSAAGIAADRIEFVGFQPMDQYFQRHHEVDIALDPLPFCGGTTSCDALWMGVPLVTLAGNTAVGRGGVSLLSNLGLREWIARTPEQYVAIAAAKANDLPALSELRRTLRSRMQSSPLTNAPQFARDMESAFREMWRTWCRQGGADALVG